MNVDNLHKFQNWLVQQGCEILPLTNEYEELRFKGRHVGVLYNSGKTSNQYTKYAIECWKKNLAWDGKPIKYGRHPSYKKEKGFLLDRDGDECFYCGLPLGEDITLEHLQALNNGGKNILSNMVLAYEHCNNEAGALTIIEKVKLAIKKRHEDIS